jgi:5-methylcytosine-specific restriction endonuclease McrA
MTLGLKRACLVCGKPVKGTRCRRCQTAYDRQRNAQRGTTTERGYGATWQAISRAVLERDGYVCRYCGGPAKTADHVIPKALGGTDDMSNLVAACRRHNSAKGARSGVVP